MRYSRLTKEQFESLNHEFSLFLASNSIDSKQWNKYKKSSNDNVDRLLDLFSDLVWDDVLNKVDFLENICSTHLFLFKCNKNSIDSIVIKSSDPSIDLNSSEGQIWLLSNLNSNYIEVLRATKKNKTNRNNEIYSLISEGSKISKGELFVMYNERLLKSSEK